MRLFEVVILLVELLFLLMWLSKQYAWRIPLMVILAGALLAQPVIEGYRWQMLPLYGAGVAFLVLAGLALLNKSPRVSRVIRSTGLIASFMLTAVGALVSILLPVPRLPEPGGPFAIGTTIYHWTDEARQEFYDDEPDSVREIMVQVWYPVEEKPTSPPEPLTEHASILGPAIAEWVSLPRFLFNHMGLVKTHTYQGAPVANNHTFPVVIYVHGWGGWRNINQDQIEALASQGYIVVSADHTYGALSTIFPDGRVAYNNPDALPDEDEVSAEEYTAAREKLIDVYAGDVLFTLDQLQMLNEGQIDDRFAGKLDMEHIGIFGHSTGGGAAIQVCAIDDRCAAFYGQDAWVVPVPDVYIEEGLDIPVMMVNSEVWETDRPENYDRQTLIFQTLSGSGYRASITGTHHYDFVMVPIFSPLAPALGLKGPLKASHVIDINSAYLTAFFDQHLKGEPSPLLDGLSSVYPEMKFTIYQP